MQQVRVGDYVSWTSRSGEVSKTKEGDVVALVARSHDAYQCVPQNTPPRRLKFKSVNMQYDRVLVAVRRKSGIYDYYAPSINMVKVVD
ncbi:MAG: hypothetical protein K0Q77_87 [Anaerosporomusa subterranea]|jgi:hypothetical protein|nr:hypothetical protein [Anaerosporomusa subterranea]